MSSKPAIIVVPGAWHVPAHYSAITTFFESQGYTVICKQNPSTGTNDRSVDNNADAASIRKLIDSVNQDVILIMHSYGGVCGSIAAYQAKNVIGLIFLAAFVLPSGGTIKDAPPHEAPWRRLDFEQMLAFNDAPRTTFYHDCDDEVAETAMKHLASQNLAAIITPTNPMGWPDLPRIYIVCTDDHTMPTHVQKSMAEDAPGWLEVKELPAGHSPFLSKKDLTNEMLESAVLRLTEVQKKA